jgi:type IV pilus assembly protein PilM
MLFGKVLSIEVGSMYTKVADIHAQNGKYVIGKNFVIPTPEGTYDDGYIHDDENLCDALFAQLHRYGMTKRRVAFTISSSKIINREIVLPLVAKNKIMPMVMANINDYFPVDISKYKVTWNIMERFTEEKVHKMKLMVIAVPMDLLESYYQLAHDINMSVEIIDYSGNSIYQLVKNVEKNDAVMSVHMGETNAMISIVSNGILELQRMVPYGLNTILEAVANAQNVYGEEAEYGALLERLKTEEMVNAVLPEENAEYDGEMDEQARLRQSVTESFRGFIDRIGRIIHYYAAMKPDMKLGKMILTGPGASIKGINQLLQFELGMAVTGMSSIHNVRLDSKLVKKEDKEKRTAFEVLEDDSPLELCEMALCVGAVIGPMDLLSNLLQGKKKKRQSLTAAITCCIIGVSVSGIMAAYATISLASANSTKERLEHQIDQLSAIDEVLQEHEEITLVYNSTLQMYDYTRNPNENLVAFIEELEEKMPASIQVLTCSVSSTGVTMSVEVADWVEAADTIAQLKSFDSLAGISVSGVTESEREVTDEVTQYYINGEPVDSLDDIELTDDMSVSMDQSVQTYTETVCSFSVTCTWTSIEDLKALNASGNDADAVETIENTEGGAES